MKKSMKQRVSLAVALDAKPPADLQLRGYLFSRSGKFLEYADVQKGAVNFKTEVERPDEVRLLLAPAAKAAKGTPSLTDLLERQKAHEAVMKFDPNQRLTIRPIPELIWKWWPFRRCHVRGNVSKNFTIHGVTGSRPICNARVHICEVDRIPFFIARIPDDIILRIPDLVLYPDFPIPVPVDPPIPFPEPGPDPLPFAAAGLKNIFSASDSVKPLSANLESMALAKNALLAEQPLVAKLQTRNLATIRELLVSDFHLFHPFFCHVHWLWPYFYRCDEIAVVMTDMNGNFDTDFYYNIFGDHPDLYFWVEVLIGGVWTTVYRPSKPCHTYWNYVCDTLVNIKITDPRVQWGCNEILPGEVVWVKTVGHQASVSHIQQSNALGALVQGAPINRIGLTDLVKGVGDFRSPFGGSLYFILQFGSGLPASRYTYYRWSFQKVKNQDLSNAASAVVELNNPVDKGYTFEYTDITGTHFDVKNFHLGPFSVGSQSNLYLIPPTSPYAPPVGATETSAHWDQNTVSIVFDSNSLQGDGLYEMTLELFDSAGNQITNIPNNLFQVPDYASFAPSVNAPADKLVASGAGTCSAFKMLMRVENSRCQAEIYKVKVNGVETNPTCCGFVGYNPGDNVELSFRAYHDTNFADFSFQVQKGTCDDPIQTNLTNASGMVLAGANGYARDAWSRFRKTFTPAQLLGTCAGERKAAFAEHLYVSALATDGNRRLHEYDASALAAFALEPVAS